MGEELVAEVFEPGAGVDTFAKASQSLGTPSLPPQPSGGVPMVRPGGQPVPQLPGLIGQLLGEQTKRQRRNIRSYGVYGVPQYVGASTIHRALAPHIGSRMAGLIGGALAGFLSGGLTEKVMKDE